VITEITLFLATDFLMILTILSYKKSKNFEKILILFEESYNHRSNINVR